MIKKIGKIAMFCLLLVFVVSCSLSKHFESRSVNQPIDGSKGLDNDKRVLLADNHYPSGNLEYLKNTEETETQKYFASANRENQSRYDVASGYMTEYAKYISMNPDDIEKKIKDGTMNVEGKDLVAKMENGELATHPLKDNIIAMQRLKYDENKIAYPDYMGEYVNIYRNKYRECIDNGDVSKPIVDNISSQQFAYLQPRDSYVAKYLMYSDLYDNNGAVFREKELKY